MNITLILIILIVAAQAAIIWMICRQGANNLRSLLETEFAELAQAHDRSYRALHQEVTGSRGDALVQARELRGEVGTQIGQVGESLTRSLRERLDLAFQGDQESSKRLRDEVHSSFEGFGRKLTELVTSNEQRFDTVRSALDQGLERLQVSNTKKLEDMRLTVDEKLQGTLEKRLGTSFALVSDRLEKVHQGLGEMQNLASGVGDLKRLMANVKTRGTWGEMQLSALLGQVMTPEQYESNVPTGVGGCRVEFAIRLPGKGNGEAVWLPIDAKFPLEDYQRLLEAQDQGDPAAAAAAAKGLEQAFVKAAKDIAEKYLNPPITTDFGVLFVPVEGLYAELLRRPGLVETLQVEHRVVVAGPTTLSALLNSLQMGFRTLAIQHRSSEVWEVLGAVKTEFAKFGGVLDKVHKKLREASNVVDQAKVRRRAMNRKLRSVEELPAPGVEPALGAEDDAGELALETSSRSPT